MRRLWRLFFRRQRREVRQLDEEVRRALAEQEAAARNLSAELATLSFEEFFR